MTVACRKAPLPGRDEGWRTQGLHSGGESGADVELAAAARAAAAAASAAESAPTATATAGTTRMPAPAAGAAGAAESVPTSTLTAGTTRMPVAAAAGRTASGCTLRSSGPMPPGPVGPGRRRRRQPKRVELGYRLGRL